MDKIFWITVIWVIACLFHTIYGLPRVFRTNEICRYNAQRIYLDLGESGKLSAHNVSVSNNMFDINLRYNKSLAMECSLELVTCPSCIIKLTLEHSNFPTQCSPQRDGPCKCDHLVFSEPPYDSVANLKYSCGNDVIIRSKTRSLQIKFIHWNNISHAFSLNYVSERNRNTITANPGDILNELGPHNQIMTSPFFPAIYLRDLSSEHLITCMVEACRIHIIFTDFQLAKSSTMEFFDSDGERIEVVSGLSFRPPVILSKGPSLIVRFYGNGGNGLGYRAKITFLNLKSASNPSLVPFMNCGGMVERVGGAITMMKMLENEKEKKLFDCIWIVRPPSGFLHYKSHLSLRVDAFENLEPGSSLIIKQGATSDRPVLEHMISPTTASSSKGFVVPLVSGFYLHFRGAFKHESRLAIIYTAFSYLNCYIGSEFLCKNHRCIPIQLHCDGFDSCGDKSDEPDSCLAEWKTEPIDRKWYSHTPNFYFPKVDQYPDLRTATTVFVASSFGLLFLISTLLFLLYRTGSRARDQRELQLQTISELLESNISHGSIPLDLPPLYDQVNCDLPSYDEVIKVGMETQMKHNARRSERKSREHRRRRSSTASYEINALQVVLPPEIVLPSTSSEPESQIDNTILVDSTNVLSSITSLDFSRISIAESAEEDAEQTDNFASNISEPSNEIPSTDMQENNSELEQNHLCDNSSRYLSFATALSSYENRHLWNNCNRRAWVKFPPDLYTEPEFLAPSSNYLHTHQLKEFYGSFNLIESLPKSKQSFQNSSADWFQTSFLANRTECSECKILQLNRKEHSVCCNCILKQYSANICISCNGRISFQDLKDGPIEDDNARNAVNNRELCHCDTSNVSSSKVCSPLSSEVLEIKILPNKSGYSKSFENIIFNHHFQEPLEPASILHTSLHSSYFTSLDDFSEET